MPIPDYFALFDLERSYALDRNVLEDRYLERAAATHPDRFAQASSGERRVAMERSAILNEAYRTLRDPVRRAEYLVKQGGIDLDSSDKSTGAPAMNQAFLVDMIERREAATEAKAGGPRAVRAFRNGIEDELEDVLDRAVAALERGDVRAAAEALVVRRYLQRLVDELEAESEAASP